MLIKDTRKGNKIHTVNKREQGNNKVGFSIFYIFLSLYAGLIKKKKGTILHQKLCSYGVCNNHIYLAFFFNLIIVHHVSEF